MKEVYLPRRKGIDAKSNKSAANHDSSVLETFSSSIPQEEGFYWYWSPYNEDFVIAEAVIRKGKMKLKIDNVLQAYFDDGAFIHSKIEKPDLPKSLKSPTRE
ncbi:MAG: hypothetical protein JJV99_06235 [Colwellia sp.]|nr:hypothetical protein [Colwellia sp.]